MICKLICQQYVDLSESLTFGGTVASLDPQTDRTLLIGEAKTCMDVLILVHLQQSMEVCRNGKVCKVCG